MEQVTVVLTPSKTTNPTITRRTTNPQLVLNDVVFDTYTLTITSEAYDTYNTTVVLNGDSVLNIHLTAKTIQSVTWVPQSKVTTIPITTKYTDDPTINVGVEVVVSTGTLGKITETWEAELINGVPSGKTRNLTSTTSPMVQREVKRGTKVPEVVLTNILTQPNAKVTYSTNTFVNGKRTTGDAVPINGSAFELRQWDAPSGALTISDGNFKPATKNYTIGMTMQNMGTAVETAKFIIGLGFFGGRHYFNGVERSIPPNAGQYDFKPYLPATAPVDYHYQFTSESGTPTGDYFQANFDNTANNTIVKISNLALYEGHVDPFG